MLPGMIVLLGDGNNITESVMPYRIKKSNPQMRDTYI